MNRNNNITRGQTRAHTLLATIAGLSIALGAHAQPVPAPPDKGGAQPAATNLTIDSTGEVYQFDLTFPGGSVSEYFDAMRAIPGVVANISLSPDARGIPMPPIRLSRVSVSVAVRAVETITDETGAPIFSTRTIEGDSSSTLYAITARPARAVKLEDEILHSFRVGSLLDRRQGGDMSADTLLGAIETLLTMDTSGRPPARVMLHKETSTLIMQGRTSQLQAVETLIEDLERDMKDRNQSSGDPEAEAFLKAQLTNLEGRRELLIQKFALVQRQMDQMQLHIANGTAPQSEMMPIREKMHALEEERLELDMALDQAHVHLHAIEANQPPRQSVTLKIRPEHADTTLEAALIFCAAMSPRADVEPGSGHELVFNGTNEQLQSVQNWLRVQNLLAE